MPAEDRKNIPDLIALVEIDRALKRCDSAIEYALDTWDHKTFVHATEQRAELIARRDSLLPAEGDA